MVIMAYITENNAERPATRKQLWAIYCLSKKDYRGQDLTMLDASVLIKRLQGEKSTNSTAKKSLTKEQKLEKEFISYMTDKMQGVIATAKEALQIKSVIETDPMFTDPKKMKQYAFFGFGCGISVINFDKRSKVGAQIKELGSKHRMSTFLKMFLKAFTAKEIKYFESVGCPLSAIYYQDIRINGAYEHAVASFMESKGVKNVRVQTFDD
jgi:hypothetical protein